MVLTNRSEHHAHVRKRVSKKLEPYPASSSWKKFLDRIIYVVGILSPVLTIPQLLKIWIGQDVSGISFISWSWYLIASIVWLMYSIAHREKPLIISSVLWIIIEVFIVIGLIIY
jgi:uncharacterized protein with PQ loop repeat